MLDSIVKFVASDAYFVSSEGPVVNLFTVAASASSATVTCTAKADIDNGDYIIIPTPLLTYAFYMDTVGDAASDPNVTGMTSVQVNISAAATAASVATSFAAALEGVADLLTGEVNTDGDVEIDVDTAGECDPISDFSCGFTLTEVIGGADANGLLKSGTPNADKRIVEVKDIAYNASTDVLTILAKIKTKVLTDATNPESSYTTTYSYVTITDSDWVLG